MSQAVESSALWYSAHLRDIVQSIRKDIVYILLCSIFLGVAGAGIGKYTNMSESSAQLVLTPMPLRAKGNDDGLAIMMATPLDVTSLSLICMGDEVMERTRKRVNDSGQLSAPIKDITKLKNRLDFEVTIAKETPYDLVYAPILQLTAKCSVPKDAMILVNTWGEMVSEAATRFQDAVQQPAVKALDERVDALGKELEEAESESEQFWTQNNIDYIKVRLEDIVHLINDKKKSRTEIQCKLIADQAALGTYGQVMEKFEPKITLDWKVSKPLLDALGPKLGLVVPKDDSGKQEAGLPPFLSSEHTNSIYWELEGKIAGTQAGVAASEAELKETDSVIESLEKERMELQATYALTITGKTRIGRKLEIVEGTYSNIKMKQEYARVAGLIKHPVLQTISAGAEWPLSRFRRAILFGGISVFFGLFLCMAGSVVYRMILKPVLGK